MSSKKSKFKINNASTFLNKIICNIILSNLTTIRFHIYKQNTNKNRTHTQQINSKFNTNFPVNIKTLFESVIYQLMNWYIHTGHVYNKNRCMYLISATKTLYLQDLYDIHKETEKNLKTHITSETKEKVCINKI